jgi:hypothetical protein
MLHCLWFLLIHDSLFKKSGTVLRAHPLHQRSWALKVSKLPLRSLKWRIGKFLEPTYAHMCSSNIVHACVRGRWHGFCGDFLFYIFWGCLGSTILPRKEFEPAKLQTKNQRKMANHAPESCWKSCHKHVSNFRTFVQVGICPCAHAVVLTCFNW